MSDELSRDEQVRLQALAQAVATNATEPLPLDDLMVRAERYASFLTTGKSAPANVEQRSAIAVD